MAREYIPVAVERLVRERAKGRCEYCCAPARIASAPFTIEHIQPVSRGGLSEEANLAFSCMWCNLAKGSRTETIDPATNSSVALFHPRHQNWSDHFSWSEDFVTVVALSATGRVTIAVLGLNRLELQNLRRVLVRSELHPPSD